MRDGRRPQLQTSRSRPDAGRRNACQEAPRRHEESTAKALGGRRQKGSGSCYDAKGDVAGVEAGRFDLHGECKTTTGKSLRLEAAWLNKITSEAEALLKTPFLAIRFNREVLQELASAAWRKGGKPVAVAEEDWIAVPRSAFVKMLEVCGEEFEG